MLPMPMMGSMGALGGGNGIALGPELVPNGNFDAGVTGWTFYDGAVLTPSAGSVTSGVLTVTGTTSPRTSVGLSGLSVGRTYLLTAQVVSATTPGYFGFAGGEDMTSTKLQDATSASARPVSLSWLANATGVYVGFRAAGACTFSIDNVSVREVL